MFPTEKKNKKALFNRIFSIAGLSIGGAILAGLIVYVARTMDVRALLASIQPLWLLGGGPGGPPLIGCASPSAKAWTR